MTSSKLIGVVTVVALLAAPHVEAQRGKKGPRRNKGRSETTQPKPADSAAPRPPATAVTPQPAPVTPKPAPVASPPPPPRPDAKTPPPAGPPAPQQAPAEPTATSAEAPVPTLPLVTLGIEPQWEGRYFRHSEFTAPNVRSYDASGYASLALTAEVFPLVNVGPKFWRGFGLTLHYARAFGFQSDSTRLAAQQQQQPRPRTLPVDTDFSRYAVGLRYRIPLNPGSLTPFVLAASASLCGWRFDFGPELPRGPDLETPTADYRMIRFGIDASYRLRPVTFFAAMSYLHAFSIAAPSSRQLDELRYPHLPTAVGLGAEIRGAVSVAIWRRLELRLSGEYAVLAFHLKSVEGRADEPARVVDAYVALGVGPYVTF